METETRTYRSALREAQAAATRNRILDAAAEEFAERGFAGATLAAIAGTAGVSVETVKLAGTKRELLFAAWEHRLGGPAAGRAFLDDAAFRAEVEAIPDAALVPALVERAAEISRRGHRLWLALLDAARTEPALRAEIDAQQSRRRTEFRLIVDELARRGLLREDRPRDELAAGLAFLVSAEGYAQLVGGSALDHERYRAWLADAITRLVAPSRAAG